VPVLPVTRAGKGAGPIMDFGKNKLKLLQRRWKKNPADYEPNLELGQFYLHQGNLSKAADFLETACSARADQARLHFVLASVYRSLENFPKSEQYFKSALELEPDDFDCRYNYALMLQESKNLAGAIGQFEQAAKLQPKNFEVQNDIGVVYFHLKQYPQAIASLKQALEIEPAYLVASVNLGYVYLETNDIAAARKLLARIVQVHGEEQEVMELSLKIEAAAAVQDSFVSSSGTELAFSDQLFEITPLKLIRSFGNDEQSQGIALSIVIPIYNEKENIPRLYAELIEVLQQLREAYEIIFIDDGSNDGSKHELTAIAENDYNVRVIQFRRNYGQTAAINAGFKYAHGSVVITMDGDLQNDPADIPRLLQKMSEGYDLVSGWRKDRHDKFLTRRVPSAIANMMINKLIAGTGIRLNDFGCTLKAYKKGVVKNINLYGEMHRFIPVFAAWLGVQVAEVEVNHRHRVFGKAKYNLSRVSRVVFDLIVVRFFSDYMTRPIQFFGKVAKKLGLLGFLSLLTLSLLTIFTTINISVNTILILGGLLLFAILQILSMGLLGEIMTRTYFEGQKKDYYVVEKIINDEDVM
jgi:glycosyltransferase involved in cell wall biosynthesis/Tfp pilus assembly protein PilF